MGSSFAAVRRRPPMLARRIRCSLARRLPGSQTRAVVLLALFAAVQLADASLTLAGVSEFGPGAEANPIVLFYINTWGLVGGLVGVKAVALASGVVLHAMSKHLALALLTVVFVFGALVPWSFALAALG
jgi:hypothetical protein